ncbi:MAG: minor capsid protein [Deltaproteobacteria bacterium]|jgi:SPP1 gp7 family putative phage head morphogenesis protein|nr:minor capsid protein [Deltaproteobacteria bacterium]
MRRAGGKRLRPIHPNAGAILGFQRALRKSVREMRADYEDDVLRFWRKNADEFGETPAGTRPEDVLASDARRPRRMTAAQRRAFEELMEELEERWTRRWTVRAQALTTEFLDKVYRSGRAQFVAMLRENGIGVGMDLGGPGGADALERAVERAVDLIRTIPREYHSRVRDAVNEGVARGRDLAFIESELADGYGITERRAAMIARDQCNRVNSELAERSYLEAGIVEAEWMHMPASSKWRPTHEAMNGQVYKVAEGLYDADEGRFVKPGELINCRCESCPILPPQEGFGPAGGA